MDTIINLLRKIKRLADDGMDGEREAAQAKLELLLEKHNLTLDDIGDQTVSSHVFRYKNKMEKDLLMQCVVHISQTRQVSHAYVRNKKEVWFKTTKAQAVDIESIYGHYRKELTKEMEAFFYAFLHRHQIFGPPDDNAECTLSVAEIERLLAMVNSMGSKSWENRKQIDH